MDSDHRVFKIKYGKILRRIRSCDRDRDMTFSELEEIVRRIFKLPETCEFEMVYTDIDKDEVTLADDSDIWDALRHQKLNPVRVTVFAQDSHPSALDDRPPLAADPPSWAADIILKLDQLLLAVNKKPVEPWLNSMNTTKSSSTERLDLEGDDDSPSLREVQPVHESEFLRRAMILRQREMTDELND